MYSCRSRWCGPVGCRLCIWWRLMCLESSSPAVRKETWVCVGVGAWSRSQDRLGPASSPGVKGNCSRNWSSALTWQQAGPRPQRRKQKIPSKPTGDPSPGTVVQQVCSCVTSSPPQRPSETVPQRAGLSPHSTVTHFSGAIPIPEMHRERNSGKGSSSLESLAPSKATLGRNPVVLFVY